MAIRSALVSLSIGLLTLAGCHWSSSHNWSFTGATAEQSLTGEFSDGIKRVVVVNEFGDVKINLAEGQPGWKWDAKVWADTQPIADEFLEIVSMDVQTDGDTQTWTLVLPEISDMLNGVKSNITLRLPAEVQAGVSNRHGDVSIENLQTAVAIENAHGNVFAKQLGDAQFTIRHGNTDIHSAETVNIDAAHGNVKVRNLMGALAAEVGHGNFDASEVQQATNIEARHSNISADRLEGDVEIENNHGNTNISTSGNDVSLRSSHGNIHLAMQSDAFESIDIQNNHANIRVDLPSDTVAVIDISANHGNADTDIPSTPDAERTVQLRNNHGNIRVEKK